MGRMEIVQQQYSIVETQQKMYFEMEMMMLEEIWADSDNKFDFDFSHRQAMEDAIQDAMDAMMEETFAMRQTELEMMLNSAEDSVSHFQDAVTKFQADVQIYLEKTKASMEVQTAEYNHFQDAVTKFQADVQIYLEKTKASMEVQ